MKSDKNRIRDKHININKDSLLQFFENRGEKYEEENPYVSVLYQDQNKELAVSRDVYEKNKVTALLNLNKTQKLLDIGCGIGRWADAVVDEVALYTGIDFSKKLIYQANKRYEGINKAQFKVMDAKDTCAKNLDNMLYDRIIISGVLIYMNDPELQQMLNGITEICDKDCLIYIREPLAHETRLTLNQFWSDELSADYSAIYRTRTEMNTLIAKVFEPSGFEVRKFQHLYDDQTMNNRKETSQFYTILQRNS